MNAQRTGFSHRQTPLPPVQPLLVHPMACLMQHAVQRGKKIRLVVPGRQTGVTRSQPSAERMVRGINPPSLEIKTDRLRHLPVECLLPSHRKMTGRFPASVLGSRCHGRPHQRRDLRCQPPEQRFHSRHRTPRLVLIKQRIVPASLPAQQVSFLTGHPHQLLQNRTVH